MRFLPRGDDAGLTGLASTLSLVIANYKPVPQLPSSSTDSSSNKTNSLSDSSSGVHKFKTTPSNYTDPHRDVSEWGVPSTLYIPSDSSSSSTSTNGHQLASSKVGPGNCPLNTGTYSPNTTLGDPTFDKFDSVKATVMRYRQQISVNLGGWFVQEGWMQNSFMSCAKDGGTSENALMQGFGTSDNGLKSAQYYMEQHWDTWITEDDFEWLAGKGINTVRIPIGYWSVGPYFCKNSDFSDYGSVYENSWKYVARAIRWAAKYDIGVLIDLHGAYGSQNGNDHSGISGSINFFSGSNMNQTTSLLTWLAWEIADVTNVVGIEVLNEPVDRTSLWTWYNSTMDAMRQSSVYAQSLPLYFHDAFNFAKGSKFVSNRDDFVVQDDHSYFVYTSKDTSLSAAGHTKVIEGSLLTSFQKNSAIARRNVVIGEWSCALAPSSLSGVSDQTAATQTYCEAQQSTYSNATSGYHYWSYKMENCDSNAGWCFKAALGKYIPSYLNTWGFSGYVTNRKILLNLASAKTVSKSITSAIAKLTVPANSKRDTAVARAAAASKNSSSDTKIAPLLDSSNAPKGDKTSDKTRQLFAEQGLDLDVVSASVHGGHVGVVTSTSSDDSDLESNSRRGVGSVAARAGRIARSTQDLDCRASTDAKTLAQAAGYSDGYLSATYFASTMSTTNPMSRMGFATQYAMDSYAVRVGWNKGYSNSYWSTYFAQFQDGIGAAETTIVAKVNAASI